MKSILPLLSGPPPACFCRKLRKRKALPLSSRTRSVRMPALRHAFRRQILHSMRFSMATLQPRPLLLHLHRPPSTCFPCMMARLRGESIVSPHSAEGEKKHAFRIKYLGI